MTTSFPRPAPMRPVPAEAHRDIPEDRSRAGAGIFGNGYWAFFWGAVVALVAYLSATFPWASWLFVFGAPLAALVVGSLFAWRSKRR
ncbi:hypothetical protein [Cellulosimicrobium cellulans]|uniref:hypothetical protein n=1 Tax=Cellulosimicrobium cellulans TaxID=1710 RepID=UPI001BA55790|nr:hypothetical protein [Cellulosimicrobium cellulans]QUB99266.1 hypothetical protein J5A69_16385 [Cellulosimicrobium cellulans]